MPCIGKGVSSGSTQPSALCMFGRVCHHARTYSHCDAHGTVVSTEPNSFTCFCTHQPEKGEVGPHQDLAVTCA